MSKDNVNRSLGHLTVLGAKYLLELSFNVIPVAML